MNIGDRVRVGGRGVGKYIGKIGDYVYVRLESQKVTRVHARIVHPMPVPKDDEAA